MRRTNTFVIAPDPDDEECLRRLLDASASFWNELTYDRRQRLFAGDSVWEESDCGDRYKSRLGAATVQTVRRVNDEAWRSFFALADGDEHPSPPSYWGNEKDGRELRTYIRNDEYTIQWGERSRLEIPVGRDLKRQYGLGYRERFRLEIQGIPKWDGKQGRLPIKYDDISGTFRAFQPVTVPASRLDSPLASHDAALDVGANNLVACSTTTGLQYLYNGRALFRQFRETTSEIARFQSKLPEGRHSSKRIQRLYRRRTRRRDHAQNALVRDLIERLYDAGVATVYVGDLTDVLDSHWSVRVNEKTHNFWAFRAFIHRLACVCEEYGISLEVKSEALTSRTCPECGTHEETLRHKDTLTCPCGFEGHADLTASANFLREYTDTEVRPMARPVRFEWDDHDWSGRPHPHDSPKE